MPRHNLPGRLYKELKSGRQFQTEIPFDQFNTHAKLKDISKPVQQGALKDDKIEEMVNEYNEHPEFFAHKRIITIAYMEHDKETYYIVDGQHRIEMARHLASQQQNCNDYMICIWHMLTNEEDMRKLFSSINKDSMKNEYYVGTEVFIQMRMDEFVKFFKAKENGYKHLFATRTNSRKYTIEEVVQRLHSDGFFDTELHIYQDFPTTITRNTFVKYILDSANDFYHKLGHEQQQQTNENFKGQWYADEIVLMEEKMVWTLNTTNFFDWIKNKNLLTTHASRYIKSRIPSHTRTAVWKKYFSSNSSALCPLYQLCHSTLNRDIKNGWQCGHITSEKNGGKLEIDNLRPICQGCNCSMGSNNWEDYEKSLHSCIN